MPQSNFTPLDGTLSFIKLISRVFPVKFNYLEPLIRAAYETLMPKLSDLCAPRDFDADRFGDYFIGDIKACSQMVLSNFPSF